MAQTMLYDYEVSHPEYGTARVSSIGPDSATLQAAEQWGVRDEWRYIARDCTVVKCGPSRRPRCRRCGREFGAAGLPDTYCPDCLRVERLYRRELRQIRPRDRRAGGKG